MQAAAVVVERYFCILYVWAALWLVERPLGYRFREQQLLQRPPYHPNRWLLLAPGASTRTGKPRPKQAKVLRSVPIRQKHQAGPC